MEVNLLEMDHVLRRILGHLSHPIDLKNCRLVDQNWNLMSTSILNDRGTTVGVSDDNYAGYFRKKRAKNMAGLNITLNIGGQEDGRSQALPTIIKKLQQDKSQPGSGSFCVKTINYRTKSPRHCLDETLFWKLVDVAAPDLEHLLVAGALSPPPGQARRFENIPAPPEPAAKFLALKSVIFDIRCHNRQGFIPRKLIQILNNTQKLEEYKLFSDQKVLFQYDMAPKQLMFIPNEDNVANISSIAGQLKTFGVIFESGQGRVSLAPVLLDAVRLTKFQNLQKLTVLQFRNYTARREFVQTLAANAKTLTSLEYNFVFSEKLQFTEPCKPPVLHKVTHIGIFYRSLFTPENVEPLPPTHFARRGVSHEHKNLFVEMLLHFELTCVVCPNLKTLATDMNICQAFAMVKMEEYGQPQNAPDAPPPREAKSVDEEDEDSDDESDEEVRDWMALWADKFKDKPKRKDRHQFITVTTLEVTIPIDMIHFQFENPSLFGTCMGRYWSTKFPALHKLVVKIDMWPHNEAGLRLLGLLNIPGITDLEIVNYCQDWIGQELSKAASTGSKSPLANLQQNLRRLRLSATSDISQSRFQDLIHASSEFLENGPLMWGEDGLVRLCGAFEMLEEVVIDRRLFVTSAPVLGETVTDKGVKIYVL